MERTVPTNTQVSIIVVTDLWWVNRSVLPHQRYTSDWHPHRDRSIQPGRCLRKIYLFSGTKLPDFIDRLVWSYSHHFWHKYPSTSKMAYISATEHGHTFFERFSKHLLTWSAFSIHGCYLPFDVAPKRSPVMCFNSSTTSQDACTPPLLFFAKRPCKV